MCGVVAVIAPGRELQRSVVIAMRDRLAHRGPDGAGVWIGDTPAGKVGLGHRRLAIIDLSAAASQPMFSRDRSLCISFNGEIYNYIELRKELQSLNHDFHTRSDTEVLLAAYAEWGEGCLSRLNGMFAFAIWDSRRNHLFVARDRFGEKPLFYTALPGGGIALASEIKALFAHPDIIANADEGAVASFAAGVYLDDTEATMFAGIRRLPPAYAMIVDPTGVPLKKWRYWIPDYDAVEACYDERKAVRRFRELLEESIRLRLRSDVPVGSSLSGGLDSSTIVCLLDRMRYGGGGFVQNTFSARFDDDPTLSEGPYIDEVVRGTGVSSFATLPDPVRLMNESRRIHWHQEEPFLSASIYLQWCVARLARDNRTVVLLDGQGADEILAGYQYFFRSYQLDCLDRRALLNGLAETLRFEYRLKRASRDFIDSHRRFNARIGLNCRALLVNWWRPQPPYAGPYEVGLPAAAPGKRLRRQLAEALQYNSLPLLLRYADRNSMAFGRETRLPFLDPELVNFCIALPDRAWIKKAWQKYILRQAADGVVPRSIQWRADKVGYAAPLDNWLRGPLKDWAFEHLFSGPARHLPGFDAAEVNGLWDRHQSGGAEASWALWRWISLNEWLLMLRENVWRSGLQSTDRVEELQAVNEARVSED